MREIQFTIQFCEAMPEIGGPDWSLRLQLVREPVCDLRRRELSLNRT
jgi:hypothetical protein